VSNEVWAIATPSSRAYSVTWVTQTAWRHRPHRVARESPAEFCHNPCPDQRSGPASTPSTTQRAPPVQSAQTDRGWWNRRVPWAVPGPVPRQMPGDGVWLNAPDPWRSGSHSGCPGWSSTAASTAGNGHLGACGLLAGPARRRSDQQWQLGRPTNGSRPHKTGISMAAPAALCPTYSQPWAALLIKVVNLNA
jgi:hypothetical protein